MVKMQNTDTNCWQRCEVTGTLIRGWWDKGTATLERSLVGGSLQNILLPSTPPVTLLDIDPKELKLMSK